MILLGWFFHYFPFYLMQRQLFLHHYFPALYFAILTLGFLVDFVLRERPRVVQYAAYGVLYTIVTGLYVFFIPICWGMTGSNQQYKYMKWFDTWRISD